MKDIHYKTLFIVLFLFAAFGPFNVDVYLPSLPHIAVSLNSSANLVKLSVSLFVFGFGISPLFYGPISDYYGRRSSLLVGLFVYLLGTIVCYLAVSIHMLILGRFIQGLGVGSCATISRSIMSDLFSGKKLAKLSSYLATCNMGIMALAPIIGGYIQHYFGWRDVFIFLILFAIVLVISIGYKLPETNANIRVNPLNLKTIWKNYVFLLKNKTFLFSSICIGMSYASIIAYYTSSPFLFQSILGLSSVQYGWVFLGIIFVFALSGIINAKLVEKIGLVKLMRFGIFFLFCASMILLFFGALNIINFWLLLIPALVMIFGHSFIFANSISKAISPFRNIAGAASALLRTIQILSGAISSFFIAVLPESNQFCLGLVMVILAVVAIFAVRNLHQE